MLPSTPPPLGFIRPEIPTLVPEPPSGEGWIHEIKHDGYRTLIVIDRDKVKAFSRHGRDSSTVRRELVVLNAALSHAVDTNVLTRPRKIYLPAELPPRERWLTRSEAAMLIAGSLGFAPRSYDVETRKPDKWHRPTRPQYHLALFILLALYTGRRKEAILSLRWPAVDFLLRRQRSDVRIVSGAPTISMVWVPPLLLLKMRCPRYVRVTGSLDVPVRDHLETKEPVPLPREPAQMGSNHFAR